jgi:hypothetical protein
MKVSREGLVDKNKAEGKEDAMGNCIWRYSKNTSTNQKQVPEQP